MCRAARAYLAEKGISYTDINIARDNRAKYRVKKLTGRQRTPVFVIGDIVVPDFDQARIEELLSV